MTTTDRERIIFLDVDGTILEHGTVIAPSTVTAIRAARARGHRVYLCTGRGAGDIHPDVRAIGVDGAITNGGAFATDGDEVVLSRPMPRDAGERLVAYFEEHGLHYFLQTHEHVYASDGIRAFALGFLENRRAQRAADLARLGLSADDLTEAVLTADYRPVAEADLDRIAKAVFVSGTSDTLERARRDLGDRFLVIPGSMPMPGGSNGEISLLGTDKGSGILAMLAHLGRSADDSVGIGDSWNDREMFDVVGTSVAMGQADPELQAHADIVTSDVLDDGVWNAFVRLGLIDGATLPAVP
ncbi:Cof-type HAD-IIB family hydrolase [Microbacterium sp.]|uniref:Cof-type HAD-IIB family hydrolase n=1 Tax=Microbacterium sp. TaxID=51671 RepID=UPI003A8C02B8